MRRRNRITGPPKDPPERPEPECFVCGSDYSTLVQEALEDGVALCEDHDSEIARERVQLEGRLDAVSDAARHYSEKIHAGLDHDDIKWYQSLACEQREKARELRAELRSLQERCDHGDADVDRTTVTGDMVSHVPEDERPETPFTDVTMNCQECGLKDRWEEAA